MGFPNVGHSYTSNLAENLATKLSIPRSKQPVRLPEVQSAINWKLVLFGKLFTSNFIQESKIEEHLNRQWNFNPPIKIKSVQRGVFQWEVKSLEDKLFLLNEGPWLVGGHIFSVKPWQKDTQLERIDFRLIDFWIQIFQLPMERMNELNASILGSSIGSVVKTDPKLYASDFGVYIRVKVSLNIKFPLPDSVEYIDDFGRCKSLKIRIERLNVFCFNCGKLGHEKKVCGSRNYISSSVIIPGRRYNASLRGKSPSKEQSHMLGKEESGSVHVTATATTDKEDEISPIHLDGAPGPTTHQEKNPKDAQGPSSSHESDPLPVPKVSPRSGQNQIGDVKEKQKNSSSQPNTLDQQGGKESSFPNWQTRQTSSLKTPEIRRRNVSTIEAKKLNLGSTVESLRDSRKRSRSHEGEIGEIDASCSESNAKPRLNFSVSGSQGEENSANPWRQASGIEISKDLNEKKGSTKSVQDMGYQSSVLAASSQVSGNADKHVCEGGGSAETILDTKERKDVTQNQQKNLKQSL